MKTTLLFLSMLLSATITKAQLYKFEGDWSGEIYVNGQDNPTWVRIKIEDDGVTQYFYNNNVWQPVSAVEAKYNYNKNNFVFYWLNNSTVWTETQTFLLSYVSDDKLYIVWSRQVNNIRYDDDNNVWSLQGTGYLTKK